MVASEADYVDTDAIIEKLKENLIIKVVDNGIGAYEYWGQRCVDKRLEPEIQSDEAVEVYIPGGFYDTLTFQYNLVTYGKCEDEEYEEDVTVKATPIKNNHDVVTFRLEL